MKKDKNPPAPAGNVRPLGQPGSPHPAASASQPASLLEEAKALHAAGRLQEAQALYERILKLQPDHWDCLYLLGVAHYQRGEYTQAVRQMLR
jgi:Flp pilus assembly protein TadD